MTKTTAPLPTSYARSPESIDRPLITLAMRHYNNAPFVASALKAAFSQTYSPLEILFLDDCSTDGGAEIARSSIEAYTGPHQVRLVRNGKNLGVGAQMMRVRDLARGEIVVFADADDVSLPRRCERVYEHFRDGGPGLLCVLNYFDFIDAHGDPIDAAAARLIVDRRFVDDWTAEMLARGFAGTTGSVMALRRKVLGAGLSLECLRLGEDNVCGFRSAVLGRMATIGEVLVHRRVHSDNLTSGVQPYGSAAECKSRFVQTMRQAVLIPSFMRRDLDRLVHDGLVPADRVVVLYPMLAINMRRVKILRVAPRLSAIRAWMSVCDLRRLGLPLRDSVRMMLPAAAPRLEILRLRRRTKMKIG